MTVSDQDKLIVKKYIETFVDVESVYYKNHLLLFYDGWKGKPEGYLWDCLKNSQKCSVFFCKEKMYGNSRILSFNDPCSSNYFSVEEFFDYESIVKKINTLDDYEDRYFFDTSFDWTCAITHEWNEKGGRFCKYTSIKDH